MACSGQISSWLHCDTVAAALQVTWTDCTTLKVADPPMRMTVVSFSGRTRPSQNRNTSTRPRRLESGLRSSRGLHWSSRRCKRCLVGTVSSGSKPRRSARNWLCWRKTREPSNPSIHRCRPYKCEQYMLAAFAICLDHAAPYHTGSLPMRQVDCAGGEGEQIVWCAAHELKMAQAPRPSLGQASLARLHGRSTALCHQLLLCVVTVSPLAS